MANKKAVGLSAGLVSVKGAAAASPDSQGRQPAPEPKAAPKPAKGTPARTGRPVTKEPSKLAPFNLPIRVLNDLQGAADAHTAGNKSKFVQDAIEHYIEYLEKGKK